MFDDNALMALESERNGWAQVMRQNDVSAYDEGWLSDEAYQDAMALRDKCRAEMGRLDAEIAEHLGEQAPEPPKKVGVPTPERVSDAESALVELAEMAADNELTIEDVLDGMVELAALIAEG